MLAEVVETVIVATSEAVEVASATEAVEVALAATETVAGDSVAAVEVASVAGTVVGEMPSERTVLESSGLVGPEDYWVYEGSALAIEKDLARGPEAYQ